MMMMMLRDRRCEEEKAISRHERHNIKVFFPVDHDNDDDVILYHFVEFELLLAS